MKLALVIFSSLALAPSLSQATRAADPDPSDRKMIGEGTPPAALPPSQSDDDPKPKVAAPMGPSGGVVEQAGIGGVTAYGRTGVVELGGSASLQAASDYVRVAVLPSIGYFFMDNIQLSALVGLSYVSITEKNPAGVEETASQTFFTLLAEPSVHIPFTQSVFGFFGLGMGLSYADSVGAGFAIQPRLGVNVMVGRSGILSPALYAQYSTHSAIQTDSGALLQVSFGYGLNLGYTVMW